MVNAATPAPALTGNHRMDSVSARKRPSFGRRLGSQRYARDASHETGWRRPEAATRAAQCPSPARGAPSHLASVRAGTVLEFEHQPVLASPAQIQTPA